MVIRIKTVAVAGLLLACMAGAQGLWPAEAPTRGRAPVVVRVDARSPGKPLRHVWQYFGYDECNYTTAPAARELMRTLASVHPEPVYLRQHFLLASGDGTPSLKWGSTNAYTEDAAGNPVYDWRILDGIFDAVTASGCRPLVEIGFMPKDLSARPEPYQADNFGKVGAGVSHPPKDYGKWADLIREWARHSAARYDGAEKEWWWQLWNEPNIHYWQGSFEEFCKLYDHTEAALHEVLPGAVLGAPHTVGPRGDFLRRFLEHCARGTNSVTGKRGARLDYVGFHSKGSTRIVDGNVRMNLAGNLAMNREAFTTIASFPEFRKKPIIIGECDPEGAAALSSRAHPPNGYRNGSAYAAYEIAVMKHTIDLAERAGVNLKGVLTWAFLFDDKDAFEGFRTLSTHGIHKPVLNGFKLLGRLQGHRVPLESTGALGADGIMKNRVRERPDIDGLAVASRSGAQVLLWNYHDDLVTVPQTPIRLEVEVPEKGIRRAHVTHWRIDAAHSNAHTLWQEFGGPARPSAAQLEQLQEAHELDLLEPPRFVEVSDGKVHLRFPLPRHGVSLVELRWRPAAARTGKAPASTASIASDPEPGPGTRHGLAKMTAALEARGVRVEQGRNLEALRGDIRIVAGVASKQGPASRLLEKVGVACPEEPESLVVQEATHDGHPVLIVVGSDDRGLLYAQLDVAERIAWAKDSESPLSKVQNCTESPDVQERAISKYTMHRGRFESTFFDERYWERYLDTLAASRFNSFVLILGYENAGYFAPPYPYLFDVESFPDVHVVGQSREKQEQNLRMLNRLIEMTHERGLEFTLAIWDHIYRGGVQGPREFAERPTPGLVWGVTADNLVPYSKAALTRLFQEVPGMDKIQFRMHGESGLKRAEMDAFWTDIYRIMKEQAPGLRFDARAKEFPDSLIDRALEIGIPIRITTKYWMEQMGLPFHPTHIHPRNQHDRRHGYADLLRYPKRYAIHWRLWSAGTSRILLWGDPEYVRRFAGSTHLYDGEGFEINEPVGTMLQDHPHDLAPFSLLAPRYRYYQWDFERYWHFFQLWGRMSYNPKTSPEIWRREFEKRLGTAAAPHIERGLHRASRILPRIVAYSYPYNRFPTTRGWAEKQRMEDLPDYARALPSDTEQFLSMDEAARLLLEGGHSAKIWPEHSARWFEETEQEVLEAVSRAEEAAEEEGGLELFSTLTDLKILASLARYHAWRARAGVAYALYRRSRDVVALDDAIRFEQQAIKAWRGIVEAAGDVYHDDLMFGRRSAGLSGHWRDELAALEAGLEKLAAERESYRPEKTQKGPLLLHVPAWRAEPGQDLSIRATAAGEEGLQVLLHAGQGDVEAGVRLEAGESFVYRGVIPGSSVQPGLSYSLVARDRAGRWTATPPVEVMVTGDHEAPTVEHKPVVKAPASRPLTVTARVTDPSGVGEVRLRYRSVTQFEDYRTLGMEPAGDNQYRATIPAEHVAPKYDLMYFIEALDRAGNGRIHPDLEMETPYVVVRLQR